MKRLPDNGLTEKEGLLEQAENVLLAVTSYAQMFIVSPLEASVRSVIDKLTNAKNKKSLTSALEESIKNSKNDTTNLKELKNFINFPNKRDESLKQIKDYIKKFQEDASSMFRSASYLQKLEASNSTQFNGKDRLAEIQNCKKSLNNFSQKYLNEEQEKKDIAKDYIELIDKMLNPIREMKDIPIKNIKPWSLYIKKYSKILLVMGYASNYKKDLKLCKMVIENPKLIPDKETDFMETFDQFISYLENDGEMFDETPHLAGKISDAHGFSLTSQDLWS